jgi:N-hydroxyarylamine O-acetyltransferase
MPDLPAAPAPFDLASYLRRIRYDGPVEPTHSCLARLQMAHVCAIPFENLDVLLGRSIALDADSLQQKIVARRRGGYCFETNGLLLAALEAIGFQVKPLSARVRYQIDRSITPPATHLFARVDLDSEAWMVDTGVGGASPTAPIRLSLLDTPQPSPHEPRRIIAVQQGEYPRFIHQARFGDDWIDVHEFTGQVMPDIDRSIANWWTSTHPDSKFRRNLFLALAHPDGSRISLQNEQFIHRRGSEILERITLQSHPELRQLMEQRFDLTWDSGTELHWPMRPVTWG